MGISKVELNGKILVDLTQDSVTKESLLSGYTAHNAAGEVIEGILPPPDSSTVPIGTLISFMGTTAPTGYLICDGSQYSISDYPYLARHFADDFGKSNYFGGDGESTFAVPDLRGEFLRGTGTATRNTGSGAGVGVHQNATEHATSGSWTDGTNGWFGGFSSQIAKFPSQNANVDRKGGASSGIFFGASKNLESQYKNQPIWYTARPTNTSVLYCIKATP